MGYKDGQHTVKPLYVFEEEGEDEEKRVIGKLKRTNNQMVKKFKFKMAGISDVF